MSLIKAVSSKVIRLAADGLEALSADTVGSQVILITADRLPAGQHHARVAACGIFAVNQIVNLAVILSESAQTHSELIVGEVLAVSEDISLAADLSLTGRERSHLQSVVIADAKVKNLAVDGLPSGQCCAVSAEIISLSAIAEPGIGNYITILVKSISLAADLNNFSCIRFVAGNCLRVRNSLGNFGLFRLCDLSVDVCAAGYDFLSLILSNSICGFCLCSFCLRNYFNLFLCLTFCCIFDKCCSFISRSFNNCVVVRLLDRFRVVIHLFFYGHLNRFRSLCLCSACIACRKHRKCKRQREKHC